MAVSIKARSFEITQDMVLYMDLTFRNDGKELEKFVATVHEASQKTLDAFPSLPTGADIEVFYSFGTRFHEFQATCSLLDLLLGYSDPQGIRSQMESWILGMQAGGYSRYTICNKVRYQGKLQDLSLPESRLARFFTRDSSCLVPPLSPPAA